MRAFVTGLILIFSLSFPFPLSGQSTSPLPPKDDSYHPPSKGGSISLFDGKTLRGWTTRGGRYDGKARWTVEEGCIVGQVGPKGEGGLLYTQRPYANFVLFLEVKIDFPFDSGVFLGMEPRTKGRRGWQVTLDHRPKGEIGGIYSDGWLQHNPKGWAFFKKNEWNRIIVRFQGSPPRIETWVGENKISDYQHKVLKGFAPFGKIGIQVHGAKKSWWRNKVRFRNLRILEIPSYNPKLFKWSNKGELSPTPEATALGWFSMLKNPKDWRCEGSHGSPFHLKKGLLTLLAEGAGSTLWTQEAFKDFEMRMDFKLSPSANSGIFLHGSRHGQNPIARAYEIQILDENTWEKDHKAKLKPWQHCGSLYGLAPPLESALLPAGAWNTYKLSLMGSLLKLRLNGRTIQNLDLKTLPKSFFAKKAKKGFLGLQIHGGGRVKKGPYLWIRNFYLRKIE
jgi:hypothetical protein